MYLYENLLVKGVVQESETKFTVLTHTVEGVIDNSPHCLVGEVISNLSILPTLLSKDQHKCYTLQVLVPLFGSNYLVVLI